jgi:hypothetical protein
MVKQLYEKYDKRVKGFIMDVRRFNKLIIHVL